MKNKLSQYLTAGEFAKIVSTTKHTLFHYDEIGIFSPEFKDKNDYRYYSPYQLEIFLVITSLKELGMSLKEIKNYLDNRSPEALIDLFNTQKSKIERKIEYLTALNNFIDNRIELTKSIYSIEGNTVFIEETLEEKLVITKTLPSSDPKSLALSISNHIKHCEKNKVLVPSEMGQILKINEVENEDYINYSHFFTRVPDDFFFDDLFVKSAGSYLTIHHTKGYETIGESYSKLLDYAKINNLKIQDNFYEDIILDDLSVEGYENYAIKISVLIDTYQ